MFNSYFPLNINFVLNTRLYTFSWLFNSISLDYWLDRFQLGFDLTTTTTRPRVTKPKTSGFHITCSHGSEAISTVSLSHSFQHNLLKGGGTINCIICFGDNINESIFDNRRCFLGFWCVLARYSRSHDYLTI